MIDSCVRCLMRVWWVLSEFVDMWHYEALWREAVLYNNVDRAQ